MTERESLRLGGVRKWFDKIASSSPAEHRASGPTASAQSRAIPAQHDMRLQKVDQHLVSILAPSSFEAEQYRVLCYALNDRHTPGSCTMIAVSSAIPGDGKTTTSINLAAVLAQDPDTRVLLIEADIRRPSLLKYLGLDDASGTGLVDMIRDPALALGKVVRRPAGMNFSILQAGAPPAAPHEVLNAPCLGQVLQKARQHYDYIVLDSPPVVPVPDCRILAKLVDGILLVVAAHKTPRKLLADALDAIEQEKLIGLVFNNDDRPFGGYGYYYRGYYPAHDQPRRQ